MAMPRLCEERDKIGEKAEGCLHWINHHGGEPRTQWEFAQVEGICSNYADELAPPTGCLGNSAPAPSWMTLKNKKPEKVHLDLRSVVIRGGAPGLGSGSAPRGGWPWGS